MTHKEIMNEALKSATSNDELRKVLNHPATIDGLTVASNGHLLLMIKSNETEDYQEYKNFGRFPNFMPYLKADKKTVGWITIGDMFPIEEGSSALIFDRTIAKEQYDKLIEITGKLGINAWEVMTPCSKNQNWIWFSFQNRYHLLIMCLVGAKDSQYVYLRDSIYEFTQIDKDAEIFINNLEELKKKEEKELKEKRDGHLWAVNVVRTAVMYVEAADIKEAEKIASENLSDLDDEDFDYDKEIDSFEENPFVDDCARKVYTINGPVDANEYFDEDEE